MCTQVPNPLELPNQFNCQILIHMNIAALELKGCPVVGHNAAICLRRWGLSERNPFISEPPVQKAEGVLGPGGDTADKAR